jgi:hypothetical protein
MNQRQINKYLKVGICSYWCNVNETIRNAMYQGFCFKKHSIDRFIKKYIFDADEVQKDGVMIRDFTKLKYEW